MQTSKLSAARSFIAGLLGIIGQGLVEPIGQVPAYRGATPARRQRKKTRAYKVLMQHFAEKRQQAKREGKPYHTLMGQDYKRQKQGAGRAPIKVPAEVGKRKNERRKAIKAVGGIRQFKKARRELRLAGQPVNF